MGIWKLAFVILAGALLTEQGRQTARKLTKESIKLGKSVAENASSKFDDLKTETSKLIEDIKVEEKEKKQQINT